MDNKKDFLSVEIVKLEESLERARNFLDNLKKIEIKLYSDVDFEYCQENARLLQKDMNKRGCGTIYYSKPLSSEEVYNFEIISKFPVMWKTPELQDEAISLIPTLKQRLLIYIQDIKELIENPEKILKKNTILYTTFSKVIRGIKYYISKLYINFLIPIFIGILIYLLTNDIEHAITIMITLYVIQTILGVLLLIFYKERKDQRNIVINQLEDIIRFIHENYEDIIKKQDRTAHQIAILKRYYRKDLSKIDCFFNYLYEIEIITSEATYVINSVEIAKKIDDKKVIITHNKEEIEHLIKYLKKKPVDMSDFLDSYSAG